MKTLRISLSEYIKWLTNDKQILCGFTFILLYVLSVSAMKEYSRMFGEPVNSLEPYMAFITNPLCVTVILLTSAVMMLDFPDISANAAFVMIRTGRARWYYAQVGFAAAAGLTALLVLLIFGIAAINPLGFVGNVWSNSSKLIHSPETAIKTFKDAHSLCYIDMSVMNNFTVAGAAITGSLLMLLYMTFSAQLQMTLTLRFNKIIGLAANLVLLGAGMALQLSDVGLRWLLPFAHSNVGLHYDELFNEMRFPISGSLAYLLAANALACFLGVRAIKRKNLSLIAKED